MLPCTPPQSCSIRHISSYNAMRLVVSCGTDAGNNQTGLLSWSWNIKLELEHRIRVHSTIFKVLNQAVASLKLRQLWTVCDCFLCLNQLSKSSVNNYQQQWWCLDCPATVDTWLWRLSIRTSSCASGKIQCRLLILFYLCLNVPSGNLCREAVLVLAGLC